MNQMQAAALYAFVLHLTRTSGRRDSGWNRYVLVCFTLRWREYGILIRLSVSHSCKYGDFLCQKRRNQKTGVLWYGWHHLRHAWPAFGCNTLVLMHHCQVHVYHSQHIDIRIIAPPSFRTRFITEKPSMVLRTLHESARTKTMTFVCYLSVWMVSIYHNPRITIHMTVTLCVTWCTRSVHTLTLRRLMRKDWSMSDNNSVTWTTSGRFHCDIEVAHSWRRRH